MLVATVEVDEVELISEYSMNEDDWRKRDNLPCGCR